MSVTKRLLLRGIRIVGQFYLDDAARAKANNLAPGEQIEITHEPSNEHDDYAAVCHWDGVKIGYIPKDMSPCCVLFAAAGYRVYGEFFQFAAKGQKNPMVHVFAEGIQ